MIVFTLYNLVNTGGMETGQSAKIEKRFLHKIVDYLKSDCYMYAPLIACSGKNLFAPYNMFLFFFFLKLLQYVSCYTVFETMNK